MLKIFSLFFFAIQVVTGTTEQHVKQYEEYSHFCSSKKVVPLSLEEFIGLSSDLCQETHCLRSQYDLKTQAGLTSIREALPGNISEFQVKDLAILGILANYTSLLNLSSISQPLLISADASTRLVSIIEEGNTEPKIRTGAWLIEYMLMQTVLVK